MGLSLFGTKPLNEPMAPETPLIKIWIKVYIFIQQSAFDNLDWKYNGHFVQGWNPGTLGETGRLLNSKF